MLFINSNVAPSVTVNIKTMDNSVNEEMIFCMSYGEKVNLYNAFMEENLEKWLQEKKVREIVEIAKDVYTGDKNATITFGFDSDFVQEQEKQRENISIFKEENMAEKKTKKYVAADDSTQTATRQQPRKEAKPVGNPGPLRFGAVVLWILALEQHGSDCYGNLLLPVHHPCFNQ